MSKEEFIKERERKLLENSELREYWVGVLDETETKIQFLKERKQKINELLNSLEFPDE